MDFGIRNFNFGFIFIEESKSLPGSWREGLEGLAMKRFLLILITTALSISLYAQKTDTTKCAGNDKIFTTPVEVMPEFKGGMERFYARLENIPYMFLDRMNSREGKTIVILLIKKDGNVSNVSGVHGISDEEDNEVIRVIKRLQKWRPGMHEGKPVRVQYAIPINFQMVNE